MFSPVFILEIGEWIGNLCDFSFMVFISVGDLEFTVDIWGAVFVIGSSYQTAALFMMSLFLTFKAPLRYGNILFNLFKVVSHFHFLENYGVVKSQNVCVCFYFFTSLSNSYLLKSMTLRLFLFPQVYLGKKPFEVSSFSCKFCISSCGKFSFLLVLPFFLLSISRSHHHHHHHHHHVVPQAWISLTLSRHFSLSFITSGRSSGLHPVSSHSCCMYVRDGRPAFAQPYVGVHRSTSLMSSFLLL